ncbi:uncharacterized protein LOC129304833 [Prosopis cineraria]|uniref:uncharacterized protein LOC129304833 n=1 Tax=Prosopis cineraria TaxID=364024 RepID=UPI002410AF3D|nr:uncharacterized protein LOC129304833 [Prosopis cineraria]
MGLLYQHRLLLRLSLLSSNIRLMSIRSLLHFPAFPKRTTFSSQRDLLHSQRLLFCLKTSSSIRPLSLRTNGYSYVSDSEVPRPDFLEENPEEEMSRTHFKILKGSCGSLG